MWEGDIMALSEFKTKSMIIKNITIEKLKIKEFKDAVQSIEGGRVYFLITQKRINPYSFILWAITKYSQIDELYIATYRISYKAAITLKFLLEAGDIGKLTILANDNYEKLMRDKAAILINLEKSNKNFKLIKKNSHAKITLLKAGDKYIVMTGSGNYSTNPKIEQYTITESRELYDFHKEWMLNG
jgi:hypothetical protein